jgi:hypothetical protein
MQNKLASVKDEAASLHGIKCDILLNKSTTTNTKSNPLDCGNLVIMSMPMVLQGLGPGTDDISLPVFKLRFAFTR